VPEPIQWDEEAQAQVVASEGEDQDKGGSRVTAH